MNAAIARTVLALALGAEAAGGGEPAGVKVVLRLADGRLLGVAEDGALRPQPAGPLKGEIFELLARDGGAIVLRVPGGPLVLADGPTLRARSPRTEPGDRETLTPVPLGENRVGLKARGDDRFVRFVAETVHGKRPAAPARAARDGPSPGETVQIERVVEVPESFCATLAGLIRDLVAAELAGKEYDKTRTHATQTFLRLPAPTGKNLLRTEKRRVLSVTDEYRIRARLDGPPVIEIKGLAYLRGYFQGGSARLAFVVHAAVPVRGHVRGAIHELGSAATSYRTTVWLAAAGQIRVERGNGSLSLNPPEVLDLHAELRSLDLGNDVLQAFRRPIEDHINHELRYNEDRLLEKANQALAKAVKARQFEHPLLRYLALP
jgi:hypothetical protein